MSNDAIGLALGLELAHHSGQSIAGVPPLDLRCCLPPRETARNSVRRRAHRSDRAYPSRRRCLFPHHCSSGAGPHSGSATVGAAKSSVHSDNGRQSPLLRPRLGGRRNRDNAFSARPRAQPFAPSKRRPHAGLMVDVAASGRRWHYSKATSGAECKLVWPQSPYPDGGANPTVGDNGLSSPLCLEKSSRQSSNFIASFIQREVTGIEQMHFCRWNVARDGGGARRREGWIVFSPDNQRWRLLLAKPRLPLRV